MVTRKRKNASSSNRVERTNISPQKASAAMRNRSVGKETKTKSLGIHGMTLYGMAILSLAIVSGLFLNKKNATTNQNTAINLIVDASFGAFWDNICGVNNSRSNTKAWCGNGKIEPTRRTLQATGANMEPIRRGEVVAEIPRALQIWETDALLSDLVQEEKLLRARHKITENPLARGAFLATYLAIERKRLLVKIKETKRDDGGEDRNPTEGSMLAEIEINETKISYFKSLPSWKDLSKYHPILKSRTDLQKMLGHHSWNFAVVAMYQEMINSEYEALSAVSPLIFANEITLEEYQTARIHVLSRSFNPGPDACSKEVDEKLATIDQERLKSDLGMHSSEIIFDKGCHAMVPILDMLNSHPHPNVAYDYNSEKQAFVISAKSSVSSGWELMNSYGDYSDSHLFAKFGFVNGDGSGFTQASIALFHRPLDVQISQEYTLIPKKKLDDHDDSLSPLEKIPDFQRVNMKRYLMYDDGYDECIQKDLHPEEFRLKGLKWLHLAKIANNPKSWIVTLHPRVPESRPRKSSELLIAKAPPEVNMRKLRVDITNLMNTCRLLALTVHDFEGNVISMLEENLGNSTFVVPKDDDVLEYRSLMFLGRLTTTALMQYPVNVEQQYNKALQLNKEYAFGNTTWTAVQLRLGEMQTLKAVSTLVFSYARGIVKGIENADRTTAFKMREKTCPQEYTDILDE